MQSILQLQKLKNVVYSIFLHFLILLQFIKMIRKSNSIIKVRLLICTVKIVPPCCRGFKDRRNPNLYEQGKYNNLRFSISIFITY